MSDDNWSDILVPGETEEGRRVCERSVQSVLNSWSRTDVEPRVVRPCSLEELPSPVRRGAPYRVLVNQDSDFKSRLALDGLLFGDTALETDLEVVLTEHTRFSSERACEAIRDRIARKVAEAERDSAASAREWLDGQATRLDAERETNCRQAREAGPRCERLRPGPDVERACRRAARDRRCVEAKERAMELDRCEIERRMLEGACKRSTELAETIRAKMAEPPAPRQPPVETACVAD